jgi:hypothetical protein
MFESSEDVPFSTPIAAKGCRNFVQNDENFVQKRI